MIAKWQQEATPDELAEYERLDELTKDGNARKRRIRQTCLQRAFAKAKAGEGVG